MKKILLALFLLPLAARAQSTMLYELSKKGVKQKSYLFGTIHVQDERAFAFNDSVFWAIDQCSKTAFELDFKEQRAEDYKTLFKNMNKAEFKENVENYLIEKFIPQLMENFNANELSTLIANKVLPPYMDLIMSKFKTDKRSLMIDQYLQTYAYQKNKEVIGIENYMEQFEAIFGDLDNLKIEDIGDFVITNLKDDNLNFNLIKSLAGSEELVNSYSQFNYDELCNYINGYQTSSTGIVKDIYQRIFYDRNDLMFNRTKDAVKKGGIFIAVGAGHLCSENGLIAQYKKAGYTVRPVNTSSDYRKKVLWTTYQDEGFSVTLPVGAELANNTGYYNYDPFDYENYSYFPKGMVKFSVDLDYDLDYEDYEMTDIIEMAADAVEDSEIEDYASDNYYIEAPEVEVTESVTYNLNEIPATDIAEDGYEMQIDEALSAEESVMVEVTAAEEAAESEEYDAIEYAEEELEYDVEDYPKYEDPKTTFKKKLTDVQQDYIKAVGDSLKHIMKGMDSPSMMGMDYMKQLKDTLSVEIDGEMHDLILTKSFLQSTMVLNYVKNDMRIKMTAKGDQEALKSEEVKQFFRNFKFTE